MKFKDINLLEPEEEEMKAAEGGEKPGAEPGPSTADQGGLDLEEEKIVIDQLLKGRDGGLLSE